MKKSSVLSEKTIKAIKKFIEKKKTEDNLMDQFPNTVLRDDVLEILGLYCTVVFYPLENEKNNGFHITGIPNRKGIEQHFVFINTAQSAEKQVFTAAHELGHVWAVDRQIEMEANVSFNSQERECVINRFAAELLMPEEHFIKIADSEFQPTDISTALLGSLSGYAEEEVVGLGFGQLPKDRVNSVKVGSTVDPMTRCEIFKISISN